MYSIQTLQSALWICIAFFTLVAASCTNPNPSGTPDQESPNGDLTQGNQGNRDTSLLLNFQQGVRAILEDSKGNFWFGSHQEGLCLFDGNKLTYFTKADGLSDNQIRSIFEDSKGVIWFEGGIGLSYYEDVKIRTYTTKDYSSGSEWQSGENDLWFKGDESIGYNTNEGHPGVYRYDGTLLTYHRLPVFPIEGGQNYYSVSTPFFKGKNGMYWFGTYGAVFGYNGESFTIIDDRSLGLNEETGYLHVRSIFEDDMGRLWIGNNGIGVLLFEGDSTINFSKAQNLVSKNSLKSGGYQSPEGSLEHVFSIGQDPQGNMWFGDRDTGAWRYDGESMKNYSLKDGLTSTHIWQIYNTRNGELWFAMGDGSVCKFNGESFERIF